MELTHYRTLGRSGLIVSPLALGTMTFGAERWGSGEATSRAVFDAYVAAGGNFIDTADVYSAGRSEETLGGFMADAGSRDRLVVATKSGFARTPGTPLHGGNSAKNIRLGLEGSLRRLRTDYIDMYWVHVWDRITPAEDVLQTLANAVRSGKILHYGFSNAPGWYVAKLATLARAHGMPAPVGLQYSYSLIDRGVELDILPAGRELGLRLVPWSPLAAGLLTGKYGRDMLAEADRAAGLPDKAGDADGGEATGASTATTRSGACCSPRGTSTWSTPCGPSPVRSAAPWRGCARLDRVAPGRVVRPDRREPRRAAEAELDLVERRRAGGAVAPSGRSERPAAAQPYFIFNLPPQTIFGTQSVGSGTGCSGAAKPAWPAQGGRSPARPYLAQGLSSDVSRCSEVRRLALSSFRAMRHARAVTSPAELRAVA